MSVRGRGRPAPLRKGATWQRATSTPNRIRPLGSPSRGKQAGLKHPRHQVRSSEAPARAGDHQQGRAPDSQSGRQDRRSGTVMETTPAGARAERQNTRTRSVRPIGLRYLFARPRSPLHRPPRAGEARRAVRAVDARSPRSERRGARGATGPTSQRRGSDSFAHLIRSLRPRRERLTPFPALGYRILPVGPDGDLSSPLAQAVCQEPA
jgi:hypothetical protein